jgi:protein-L-isoaspartate(D-aspartate) O-methyltransferase
MVESQVARRGVRDDRVLMAMRIVPRERFIPDNLQKYAYEDAPLPVDAGQTISQPFVVALMVEALELTEEDRVLEIGAGSGNAAAVLGQIAREVYAVEWHPSLAEQAERRVKSLGYDNVHIRCGDGTLGWQEHAPYDAIVVAAGGPKVPETLREQLALGGRLVIPVGPEPRSQELMRVRRTGRNEFERESLGGVRFVPLVGSQGWSQDGPPQERSEAAPNLP